MHNVSQYSNALVLINSFWRLKQCYIFFASTQVLRVYINAISTFSIEAKAKIMPISELYVY